MNQTEKVNAAFGEREGGRAEGAIWAEGCQIAVRTTCLGKVLVEPEASCQDIFERSVAFFRN